MFNRVHARAASKLTFMKRRSGFRWRPLREFPFAVVLMLVQLGLLDALFAGASLVQDRLKGDIVLTSNQY